MRKSPVRHRVNAHMRRGFPVKSYVRGSGTGRTLPPFTRRRVLTKKGPKSYTVNFKYSQKKGDGESVIVIAKDYKSALDEALEERKSNRQIVEVEIIDPSLGRVLHTIGRGAVKAAYLGAKYTIKGVTALGKVAALELARQYRDYKVKSLVQKCYSLNRNERIMARVKLKREFPEIYRVCDFSKPGEGVTIPITIRPKVAPTENKLYKEEEKMMRKVVAQRKVKD